MPPKISGTKQHIVYHKDGSIWAKGRIVDGKPVGYWEWFRKPARPKGGDGTSAALKGRLRGTISSNRMRSGHFKKGEQTGEWITYDKKGKIYKITSITSLK